MKANLQHIMSCGVEVVHVLSHVLLCPLKLLVEHICRQPCIIAELLLQRIDFFDNTNG